LSASERHLRVHRSARFYLRGSPGAGTKELWIACHGYGQLAASFSKALAPLDHETRVVAVPEALNRFYLDDPMKRHGPDSPVGATWMTREDREREIADYVAYLDQVVDTLCDEIGARAPALPVVALGFSQGVATITRWAALGRTRLRKLILWSGTLPQDLPADRGDQLFRGAELVLVVGRKDSLVSSDALDQAQADLARQGIHPTLIRFEGGHSLNSDVLRQLASA
jgi:predicted esterase